MSIPDRAPTARELAIWHQLRGAIDTIRDLLDEQLRDSADLTISQFGILHRLRTAPDGTLTMTELADGLAASRSGMTHQIGKLERLGLIVRQTSRVDERSREVTLTDAGRARVAEMEPHHNRLLHHLLFDQIDPSELDGLEHLVHKITAHLATAPPRSVRRRRARALRDTAD